MTAVRKSCFGVSRRPAFAALFVLLLLSLTARGQQKTFVLDPAQSTIHYTVAGNFHTVHGTFRFQSGSVTFDPQSGVASGRLIVDANSGDSGSEGRDSRMKRAILETEKYPEVTLTLNRMEGAVAASGPSTVTLQAILVLHGEAHAVTIPAQVVVQGSDTRVAAEIVIPYVAWGLKNPSTFILRVSDKVTMQITAVGRLADSAAQTSNNK